MAMPEGEKTVEVTRKIPASVEAVLMDKEELSGVGVEMRQLANGIIVIGVARGAQDTKHATIEVSFPFGARQDPAGQAGLSHFFEHMLPAGILEVARGLNIKINASTGVEGFTFDASGLVLGEDTRMLAFIPEMARMLADPLAYHNDELDIHFRGERARIKGEIEQSINNPGKRNARAVERTIWGEGNPRFILARALGTSESISKITLENFAEQRDKYLVPDGMIVRVFTGGTESTLAAVMDQVEASFDSFPRVDVHNIQLDQTSWATLNPDFAPGSDHQIDTGYPENQAHAALGWTLPSELYSVRGFAIGDLSTIIGRRLQDYIRKTGSINSYSAGGTVVRTETHSILGIDIQVGIDTLRALGVGNVQELRAFLTKHILPEILHNITEADIQGYLDTERVDATDEIPIPLTRHLDDAINGLREYGRPLSATAIRSVNRSVTAADILAVLQELTNETAIATLVGDLTRHDRRPLYNLEIDTDTLMRNTGALQ